MVSSDKIIFSDNDGLYIAIYSEYFETITVRELDSKRLIYRRVNVCPMEWAIFKLRLLKWKKPVQDVENH